MKKILILSSIIATLFFSGCASSTNGQVEPGSFKFEKVGDSETIYNATYSEKGKKENIYFLVGKTIKDIKKEALKRGYNYFQIVSPKVISNFDGFPITNEKDLGYFLNPQMSMPYDKLNLLETRKTLMDNQNSQSAVNVPLTIFQDTEFKLVVRLVKEPMEDEIVWNANK